MTLSFRQIFNLCAVIAFISSSISCSYYASEQKFRDIEMVLDSCPDSALVELQRIKPEYVKTTRQRATFTLLYAIALDKNYVDDGSYLQNMEQFDRWYRSHGNKKQKQLFLYYLGDQQKDAGLPTEAIVSFSESLALAEKREDWFYCGMSCREISEIFSYNYLFEVALRYATQSADYFKKTDRAPHQEHAAILLSQALYNDKQYEASLAVADSLLLCTESTSARADALCLEALCMMELDGYPADSVISRFEEYERISPIRHPYRSAMQALAYFLDGQIDRADQKIKEAYLFASTPADSMKVINIDAQIKHLSGNSASEQALVTQNLTFVYNEVNQAIKQSALKSLASYYKSHDELVATQLKNTKIIILIFSLLALSVFALVFCFLKMKAERAKLEEQKRSLELDKYIALYETMSERLTSMSTIYNKSYTEAISASLEPLKKLSDSYYYKGYDKAEKLYGVFDEYLKAFHPEELLGKNLEAFIDATQDDIIKKMRNEFKSFKEEDFQLALCLVANLPYSAICLLIGENNKAVIYNRVMRLRARIEKSGSQNTNFYLSKLPKRSK